MTSWDKILLSETSQIKPFLETYVGKIVGTPVTATVKARIHSLTVRKNEADYNQIILLSMLHADNRLFLKNLNCYTQGRGLSKLNLKAALCFLSCLNYSELTISTIIEDGLPFWPHMGSYPLLSGRDLSIRLPKTMADISEILIKRIDGLQKPTEDEIERVQQTCYKFPLHVWRFYSQSRLTLDNGSPLFREAFPKSHFDWIEDHILLPADPSTRAILQRKLGKIPHFIRQSKCADEYRETLAQLHKENRILRTSFNLFGRKLKRADW